MLSTPRRISPPVLVLVSALVLGVVGTFSMGIASEGPARRASTFVPHNDQERAIGRALASFLVGLILIAVVRSTGPIRR